MKLMKYSGYLGAIGTLIEENTANNFQETMESVVNNR